MPEPVPAIETFVHSNRVEGVHLRFGAIARGGLRWSDRLQDYRTEILGLVKAQAVKNAVIVPVGAKGGFVVKRPPAPTGDAATDRDAARAEGVACYRMFVSGLLDLVDDREGHAAQSAIRTPDGVVRYDGDDSYLVVAADKGTATFSDLANAVAADYGFWLGDAFASGGSVGYDHKAMGITARGAWESVRRHFRELGTDVASDEITVVGVGDMSGDVFGNGMLLSEHLRIVAAFDHRHVFLDPDPDPAVSFAERQPALRAAALVVGRLRRVADQRGRRGLPAHHEGDPGVGPRGRGPGRRAGQLSTRRRWSARSCGPPPTCCGTAASAPTSRRPPRRTPTWATRATTRCASTATSCASRWSVRAGTWA